MLPTGSRLIWIYSQGAITSREIMWMRRLEFAHSQERVQTDEDMDAFDLRSAALLVPREDRLQVVASTGEPLSEDELGRLAPYSGRPVSLGTAVAARDQLQAIALSVSDRPVGLLAVRGLPSAGADSENTMFRPLLANAWDICE